MNKAVAGGIAWVIALSLQVAPALWPDRLKPHPYAMGIFLSLGFVLFVYASLNRGQTIPHNGVSAGMGQRMIGTNAEHPGFMSQAASLIWSNS
jgi:hypothetical protein